ncbi:hypothetical protein ACFPJ1_39995 [Kribbella qitaiheensis]|uniref:hypothetical protein n=1 Tax=Kribbella qitaiheensis TaxID=1544730 RepID=UPI003616153B
MTAEWNTGSLDLDAYLRRIQHPRVVASVEALHSLHTTYADGRTTRRAVHDDEVGAMLADELDDVLIGEELDRLRLVLGQR